MNKIFLASLSVMLVANIPYAFADLTDDLHSTSKQVKDNTRIIKHFSKVIEKCGDTTDQATTDACNKIYTAFNIEASKAYSESESDYDDIGVDIPSTTIDSWQFKDIADTVDNSTDTIVLSLDALSLMMPLESLGTTCADSAEMYDFRTIRTCMDIASTLHDHLKEFEDSTKAEFTQVLG